MDNNDLFELGQQILLFMSYLALSTQGYVFRSKKPQKTNPDTHLYHGKAVRVHCRYPVLC